jgi:transposase
MYVQPISHGKEDLTMARAYSIDLRERVVACSDNGFRPEELAIQFNVSERWIYSLLSRRKATGNIEPLSGGRGREPKLKPHDECLLKLVAEKPDRTLEELRAQVPVSVSVSAVFRRLSVLGLSYKKRLESR